MPVTAPTIDYSYAYNGVVMRLQDIGLSFGDKVILRDVNAEIRNITRPGMQQGQVVALLGPSGIGKTQLFRILSGLAIPGGTLSGRVLLGERDTPVTPGIVGVVAQHYPLFRHRTVEGNLRVAGRQAGKAPADVDRQVRDLLQAFDLTERAEMYPSKLSGGQRQRVAIAQQLMCSEYFMLMDEPFSGLDPVMTARVIELIQQVTCMDEYNTTILVTHDISSAIAVADTLWIMGRDRNSDGSAVPGAYIKRTYDLAAAGLCWRPDIRHDPKFAPLANEIRDLFPTL